MRQRDTGARASASVDRLVWGGVVGPVVFTTVFLVLGAVRPGYEPLRHQVSYLSLGDGGWIQTASFLVTGVLVLAFAIGLRRRLTGGVGAIGIPVAVGFAGAGLVFAGLFPTMPAFGYPPGTPNGFPTAIPLSAYVHVAGAIAFFCGLIAAPLLMARRFRRTEEPGWAALSFAATIAILVFFTASSADPSGQPFVPALAGLFQRLAILAGLGWMAVVAGSFIAGRLR
jgi:hypothetical membrane protein